MLGTLDERNFYPVHEVLKTIYYSIFNIPQTLER